MINKLAFELEFEVGNNKKYKKNIIKDSIIYIKKVRDQLSDFYYLVFCKNYLKTKNI